MPAPGSGKSRVDLAHAQLLTGGEAVAEAMRQIDPDVVPVYPITPQTPIIQTFAKAVADGRAHGELVDVESEHSAMSAGVGSAACRRQDDDGDLVAGARAYGVRYVYIAVVAAAPIVLAQGTARCRARSTSTATTRTPC